MNRSPYPFLFSFFEKATNGLLVGEDRSFTDISIDSRNISASSLFVAIRGKKFDGHDFIPDVIKKGVMGIVAEKNHPVLSGINYKDVSCLQVINTQQALGDMAKAYKAQLNVKTVAITGSSGKTSTRKLIANVLRKNFSILTSEKNFNNEIGVPLTLLKLRPEHEWAVIELGMSGFGEIARLTDICQPDIGVVSNIGMAHLSGVGGTLEGVLIAKTELFTHMSTSGIAIINMDDFFLRMFLPKIHQKVITYGTMAKADVQATNVQTHFGKFTFKAKTKNGTIAIEISTINRFMVLNALSAIAVGLEAGITLEDIATSLKEVTPIRGRMNPIMTQKQILVIDDTYNANPSSASVALDAIRELPVSKKIVVLGDMGELGEKSAELHYQIGTKVAEIMPDRLYLIGSFVENTAQGAKAASMPENAIFIGSHDAVVADLVQFVSAGDAVLVKGSRIMEMEKVVEPLVVWANKQSG